MAFSWPTAWQPFVRQGTTLLVVHGSRAYGTSTPTSDWDYKGVAHAPAEVLLGFNQNFEQAEHHPASPDDADVVIYELKKFCRLAADCNPNIIEVLWVDQADVLVELTIGKMLRDRRAEFLSKKAKHTFSGYAIAQLKRIQTHRRWLMSPPTQEPTRTAYGLPERTLIPRDQLLAVESSIKKQLDIWNIGMDGMEDSAKIQLREHIEKTLIEMKLASDEEQARAAGRAIGLDTNFIELLDKERRYTAARREWDQYNNWKATRNDVRAELEAKYGYDTKHGMHLVRLMRMCREILVEGLVHVKRPDAAELLAIRGGAWSYDKLIDWAQAQDAELTELAKTSPLPHAPDRKKLDALCQWAYQLVVEDR